MELSNAQKKELEVFCYFGGMGVKPTDFSDEELKEFYDHSERGIGHNIKNLNRVGRCKMITGVMMGEYERGILDGSMPYFVILGGYEWLKRKRWWQFWKRQTYVPMPRLAVDFMKKEMFKGADVEIIEQVYQGLLK